MKRLRLARKVVIEIENWRKIYQLSIRKQRIFLKWSVTKPKTPKRDLEILFIPVDLPHIQFGRTLWLIKMETPTLASGTQQLTLRKELELWSTRTEADMKDTGGTTCQMVKEDGSTIKEVTTMEIGKIIKSMEMGYIK